MFLISVKATMLQLAALYKPLFRHMAAQTDKQTK